jgi:hypothetical protein
MPILVALPQCINARPLARYTWPVFTGHLSAQIDGNYLSKFWFGVADIPDIEQGSYGLANARLN